MRTLERITVTGYKSIRELQDFALGDLNVLIGANGAGKSNFLSVIKLLKELSRKRFQQFIANEGYADAVLYFGRKVTKEMKLEFLSNKYLFKKYQITFEPSKRDTLLIANERISKFPENERKWQNYRGGREESILPEAAGPAMAFLSSIFNFAEIYQFHDTSDNAPVKQYVNVFDTLSLNANANNLAALLYRLRTHQPQFYNRIVKTVQLAAPFFDDFWLYPESDNPKSIRLRWRHKKSENNWDVSQLSDGTIRFICLATLLLQPSPPALIIIDEPELGLHPAAIELLVEMLRSATTSSQVIISTQSVEMVNHFRPEEIIVVDREKDESVFHRKSAKELETWLDEYSMGELWQMNVIGGRP